jgi:hypothetical protein
MERSVLRRLACRLAPLFAALAAAAPAGEARAEGAAPAAAPRAPAEPAVRPTLVWAVVQALPSPEWVLLPAGVRFGARWQVTPLLYSFGIHPRLSPWRALVAEPLVRHAGSIELYGSPAYLAGGGGAANRWLLRAGLRAYFPLLDRGEYLSCSLGGAALYFRDQPGAAYEAGLYTVFGVIGLQIAYAPAPHLRAASLTLNLRYF